MCQKREGHGLLWGDGLRGIVTPVHNKKRPDYV